MAEKMPWLGLNLLAYISRDNLPVVFFWMFHAFDIILSGGGMSRERLAAVYTKAKR